MIFQGRIGLPGHPGLNGQKGERGFTGMMVNSVRPHPCQREFVYRSSQGLKGEQGAPGTRVILQTVNLP